MRHSLGKLSGKPLNPSNPSYFLRQGRKEEKKVEKRREEKRREGKFLRRSRFRRTVSHGRLSCRV
jgi:hypothetical protein